jgi:hypothetical protein
MGGDMFSFSETVNAFQVRNQQLLGGLALCVGKFNHVPFSEEQLENARDSHSLIPVLPLSLKRMYDLCPSLFRSDWLWWLSKPLAGISGFPRWCLIRKTPEPSSVGQLWAYQKELAKIRDFSVPPPRIVVYSLLVNFLARRERLLKEARVRCSGKDEQSRWEVGHFDDSGIVIMNHAGMGDGCDPQLGVASMVKPIELYPRHQVQKHFF